MHGLRSCSEDLLKVSPIVHTHLLTIILWFQVALPVLEHGRATIDPPESYKRPVTLQEQPQEILTKILQGLSLCDQTCLALTCKDLLVKIHWTKEYTDASARKDVEHKLEKPNHLKVYDIGSDHSHADRSYNVLGCPLGDCFWKNWRVKKWAFKVEYEARERRRLGTVQDDEYWSFYRVKQWAFDIEEIDEAEEKSRGKRKLSALEEEESSLEHFKSAPVDTVSVYARMAMRYSEGRYELKATVASMADFEREKGIQKPKKLSKAEKRVQKRQRPSYSVDFYGWGGQRRFMQHTA